MQFDDRHTITLGGEGPKAPSRTIHVNQVVGGSYKLIALLGHGGMGYVFHARHLTLNGDYALKMLAPEAISENAKNRFLTEARAIAGLEHQNIVRVYNMGLDDGVFPFYVMDRLEGIGLDEYIKSAKSDGSINGASFLALLRQIAAGLEYAHSRGIVHRDIKPSNVMLVGKPGANMQAKIVDFGIAKILSESQIEMQSQTATGEIFGSPLYMSPEQCSGQRVGPASDMYSLGCTFYEMLTGRPPYQGTNAMATVMMHATSPMPALDAELDKLGLPRSTDAMLARMLAKRPGDRYLSMAELIRDLDRLAAGKEIRASIRDTASGADADLPTIAEEDADAAHKPPLIVMTVVCVGLLLTVAAIGLFFISKPPVKYVAVTKGDDELQLSVPTGIPEKDIEQQAVGGEEENLFKKAEPFYARARPIISHRETINGAIQRVFNFPDYPIGTLRGLDGPPGPILAKGTLTVDVEAPLALHIGEDEASMAVYTYPEIVKKIGLGEFACLVLDRNRTSKNQHGKRFNGSYKIVDYVQPWQKLQMIQLVDVRLENETFIGLSQLPHLKTLILANPDCQIDNYYGHNVFQNISHLSLKGSSPPSLVLKALSRNQHLTELHLIGCQLDSEALSGIAALKHLQEFVYVPSIGSTDPAIALADVVRILGGCASLQKLRLLGLKLSADDVIFLSRQRELKHLYLSEKLYMAAEKQALQKASPIVEFIDEDM